MVVYGVLIAKGLNMNKFPNLDIENIMIAQVINTPNKSPKSFIAIKLQKVHL